MLVQRVSGGGRKTGSARKKTEAIYHLDVRFIFRLVDILDVAGADSAGSDFGLELAVGGGDGREEGIEAGEHYVLFLFLFFLAFSCVAQEGGRGEGTVG